MITTQNSVLSGAPTPQELELINNYTVKPLSADEVDVAAAGTPQGSLDFMLRAAR